jgi:hypothetical protein
MHCFYKVSLFFCISEQASRGFFWILFLCGHGIILWQLPTEKNCFFFDTNAWFSLSVPFLPAFRCLLSSLLRQQTACLSLGPTAVRGHAFAGSG